MPEPLLHFAIPFSLAKTRFSLKQTLLIASLALLPDMDVLLHIHRSMTHSLVVVTLVFMPVLVIVYRKKRKYLTLAAACYLAIVSHILLDVFQTYTPILYPLLGDSIRINAEGSVVISSTITPRITASIQTKPTEFTAFQTLDAPLYTSEGLVISMVLIVVPILLSSKFRRVRENAD
ncbi:MAG: metal-dependent hydrolase [Thermofilum sp.]